MNTLNPAQPIPNSNERQIWRAVRGRTYDNHLQETLTYEHSVPVFLKAANQAYIRIDIAQDGYGCLVSMSSSCLEVSRCALDEALRDACDLLTVATPRIDPCLG